MPFDVIVVRNEISTGFKLSSYKETKTALSKYFLNNRNDSQYSRTSSLDKSRDSSSETRFCETALLNNLAPRFL
jgi:hypothetical protein